MTGISLPAAKGRPTCFFGGLALGVLLVGVAPAGAAGTCPVYESYSKGLPTAGEWRTHPALGDVNGDKRPDVAGHIRKGKGPGVFLQNGKGWKSASTGLLIPGFSCGVGVDLGDMNGDGHADLAVADHCQGLFLYLGDGGKSWKLSGSVTRGAEQGFEDVQIGDLDGDGHLDMVAVGSFRGGIAVFAGDGTGKFKERPSAETGLPSIGYGSDVALVDANGDGRLDVAAAYSGGVVNPPPAPLHRNALWLSEPDGKYRPAMPGVFRDGRHYGIAVGDVNGDGRHDVAVSRDRGLPLHVYLREGDAAWKLAVEGLPGETGGRFWGIQLVDLNGDGFLDLIANDHPAAGLRLWTGDGTGRWSECTETGLPKTKPDLRGWGVDVGDVNGDGRPDVAAGFGRSGSGSLEVWVLKP